MEIDAAKVSVPIETEPAKRSKREPIFMDDAERNWAIKRLAEDTEIIGECIVWRGHQAITRNYKQHSFFRIYAAVHDFHVPDEYKLVRTCSTNACHNKDHVIVVEKPHDKPSLLAYLQTNARQEGSCIVNDWICKDGRGYGTFYWNKKSYATHRLVFWANNDLYETMEDIPRDRVVAHACRNKTCMTPSHYRLATHTENSRDKIRDGTQAIGEASSSAKITLQVAQAIADSWADVPKKTREERAKTFGVLASLVDHIDRRTTWKEVIHPNGRAWVGVKRRIQSKKNRSELGTFTKSECEELRARLKKRKGLQIDEKTECWNVPPSTVLRQRMSVRGIDLYVSTVACIINNNGVDEPNKEAAHKCGSATCVNPKHLVFKTRQQNEWDKFVHGSGRHILSIETVREIRSLPHLSSRELARRFKASMVTINSVRANRSWQKHIIDQVEKEHLEDRA